MPEPIELQTPEERRSSTSKAVSVTLIVSCAMITLACIVATAVVLSVFFANPPW